MATSQVMATLTPTDHLQVASDLLARLHSRKGYINNRPYDALEGAGPEVIATAALAHGLLALVEEVAKLAH